MCNLQYIILDSDTYFKLTMYFNLEGSNDN